MQADHHSLLGWRDVPTRRSIWDMPQHLHEAGNGVRGRETRVAAAHGNSLSEKVFPAQIVIRRRLNDRLPRLCCYFRQEEIMVERITREDAILQTVKEIALAEGKSVFDNAKPTVDRRYLLTLIREVSAAFDGVGGNRGGVHIGLPEA